MMTVDPETKITAEEITAFGEAFKFAPEPTCEVRPEFHGDQECQHTVHHLLRTCRGQGFACDIGIAEVKKSAEAGHNCASCQRPVAEDWRYIPI